MSTKILRAVLASLALGLIVLQSGILAARDQLAGVKLLRPLAFLQPRGMGAAPFEPRWARTYDVVNYDTGYAVQPTGDGGLVMAGEDVREGAGAAWGNVWVTKIQPSGSPDWVVTCGSFLGSDDYSCAHALVRTQDGGYFAAGWTGESEETHGDLLAFRLAGDGSVKWMRTYGGDRDDRAYCALAAASGGFIVAGETSSFGSKGTDAWVLKLGAAGSVVWQTAIGGRLNERLFSIRTLPGGDYIAVGTIQDPTTNGSKALAVRLSPNGVLKWEKVYEDASSNWGEARSICLMSDGGCLVAGSRGAVDASGALLWSDIRVLKLDGSGRILWQKSYADGNKDRGMLVIPANGGYMVAGLDDDGASVRALVLQLGAGWIPQWQKVLGAQGTDWSSINGAFQADNGNLVMTGALNSKFLVMSVGQDGLVGGGCPLIFDASISIVASAALPRNAPVASRRTSALVRRLTNPQTTWNTAVEEIVCEEAH